MKIYLDTSFLISLYSPDINSGIAARAMHISKGDRVITTLVELEVVNALGLRVFRKVVSAAQAQASVVNFEKDLLDGILRLRPLSEQAFGRARELSRQSTARLGTRTADLLHVAAALEFGVDASTASTSSSAN